MGVQQNLGYIKYTRKKDVTTRDDAVRQDLQIFNLTVKIKQNHSKDCHVHLKRMQKTGLPLMRRRHKVEKTQVDQGNDGNNKTAYFS